VARAYRAFARLEARGRSAAYESLAESVADDAALTSFVASLPPAKRQPNLLFAAARYLLGAPPGIGPLRELVSRSRTELTHLMLTRRTQTNEPARCAVLLPSATWAPPGCPAKRPASCPSPGPSPGPPVLARRPATARRASWPGTAGPSPWPTATAPGCTGCRPPARSANVKAIERIYPANTLPI
jgi:hypothetical protein